MLPSRATTAHARNTAQGSAPFGARPALVLFLGFLPRWPAFVNLTNEDGPGAEVVGSVRKRSSPTRIWSAMYESLYRLTVRSSFSRFSFRAVGWVRRKALVPSRQAWFRRAVRVGPVLLQAVPGGILTPGGGRESREKRKKTGNGCATWMWVSMDSPKFIVYDFIPQLR